MTQPTLEQIQEELDTQRRIHGIFEDSEVIIYALELAEQVALGEAVVLARKPNKAARRLMSQMSQDWSRWNKMWHAHDTYQAFLNTSDYKLPQPPQEASDERD